MDASDATSALDFFPDRISYSSLRDAAAGCRGCDLYKLGIQTVFGEGPTSARVIMIGEQPGDEEDKKGHPFVGPAGRLLDKALVEAGVDRDLVYVTNSVKHFKWKQGTGKRRIHEKPSAREVAACRPWLNGELEVIHAELVVCLGATAAQNLLGREFRVTKSRGEWMPFMDGRRIMATVHPSSILRAPDDRRETDYRAFVADLTLVSRTLAV